MLLFGLLIHWGSAKNDSTSESPGRYRYGKTQKKHSKIGHGQKDKDIQVEDRYGY